MRISECFSYIIMGGVLGSVSTAIVLPVLPILIPSSIIVNTATPDGIRRVFGLI